MALRLSRLIYSAVVGRLTEQLHSSLIREAVRYGHVTGTSTVLVLRTVLVACTYRAPYRHVFAFVMLLLMCVEEPASLNACYISFV